MRFLTSVGFTAIFLLFPVALRAQEASVTSCSDSAETTILPEASTFAEVSEKTAFLGRERAGPLDGLFLFEVSRHDSRVHVDLHRLDVSEKTDPLALKKIRNLAGKLKGEESVSDAELNQLQPQERLLLLSLLSRQPASAMTRLRNRLGFSESMVDGVATFRDRKSELLYAQKGQVILEFGKMDDASARQALTLILHRQKTDFPLSVWNPRTELWVNERVAGIHVPAAARMQMDIGEQDQTVFGGFDKTRAWHTEVGVKAMDGVVGARDIVHDVALQSEHEDRAKKTTPVYSSHWKSPFQQRQNAAVPPPLPPGGAADLEAMKQYTIDTQIRPQAQMLEQQMKDSMDLQSLFAGSFSEETNPSTAAATATAPAQPPKDSTVTEKADDGASSFGVHGGAVKYQSDSSSDGMKRHVESSARVTRGGPELESCVTDTYSQTDLVKYCYNRGPVDGSIGQKFQFQSLTTRTIEGMKVQLSANGEVRKGDYFYTGSKGGIVVSTDVHPVGTGRPVTYFVRVDVAAEKLNPYSQQQFGSRHCDAQEHCLEVSIQRQRGYQPLLGLDTTEYTTRSVTMTYTSPF